MATYSELKARVDAVSADANANQQNINSLTQLIAGAVEALANIAGTIKEPSQLFMDIRQFTIDNLDNEAAVVLRARLQLLTEECDRSTTLISAVQAAIDANQP